MPLTDIWADASGAADTFDFLSEPATPGDNVVIDDGDVYADDSNAESDDTGEASEAVDEASDSQLGPDIDELLAQLGQRDQLIQTQAEQIGHLAKRLDAPQAKPYEQLDPNNAADAEEIAECEREAAEFNIDPAYVHRDRVIEFRREEKSTLQNCISAVGRYVDEHPDAAELGDKLAAKVRSDPAWRAQLRVTGMLAPTEMIQGARAAIDGMYAQLKLEHVSKRSKAEVQAAQLQAERQGQNNERARRRGGAERAGVAPGRAAPGASSAADRDSFDAVLAHRSGGFWSAFK